LWIGQAILAALVLVVGLKLNKKSESIHVLVNQRMSDALTRIDTLEHKLGLEPGEEVS
jgi:hypothetical protein